MDTSPQRRPYSIGRRRQGRQQRKRRHARSLARSTACPLHHLSPRPSAVKQDDVDFLFHDHGQPAKVLERLAEISGIIGPGQLMDTGSRQAATTCDLHTIPHNGSLQ